MHTTVRLSIGLAALAIAIGTAFVLLASLVPQEGPAGHAWLAALAVIPPTAAFGLVAMRMARQRTERARAEQDLRDSRARYRSIFENTGTALTVNRQGIVTDCNASAGIVLGHHCQELIGTRFEDLVLPEYRSRAQKLIRAVMRRGSAHDEEYRMVRKDGSILNASIRMSVIKDGADRCECVICMITDVTVGRQMERIFNAAADAMRVMDADLNVLWANTAFGRLSGCDGPTERKCHEGFGGPLCGTAQCVTRRILEGEERVQVDTEMLREDGSAVACTVTATPLRGPDGSLVAVMESLKDAGEMRRAREHLQHSQLLASLGEMTAGIAHEVNNPLGSILLYSELLMAGDHTPQTKQDLRVIHDEARRAARIISNLLTYGRRRKTQLRRLDLHRLLKKLLQMREYAQRVREIEMTLDLAAGPLLVKGDSAQLNQVFMNLILNAEEALKVSGGGRISVTTRREGEWARVSVADNGNGIAPENLTQVFYPFFTTKEVGDGTGLGLSTCYGIVTDHKGLIRADNNEMGGATFTVELPLTEGAGTEPQEERAAEGVR